MAATEVVIRRSLVRAQVEEPGFSVERQALRSMARALFSWAGGRYRSVTSVLASRHPDHSPVGTHPRHPRQEPRHHLPRRCRRGQGGRLYVKAYVTTACSSSCGHSHGTAAIAFNRAPSVLLSKLRRPSQQPALEHLEKSDKNDAY